MGRAVRSISDLTVAVGCSCAAGKTKVDNYLAFIHLQFAYVTLRAVGVLG